MKQLSRVVVHTNEPGHVAFVGMKNAFVGMKKLKIVTALSWEQT